VSVLVLLRLLWASAFAHARRVPDWLTMPGRRRARRASPGGDVVVLASGADAYLLVMRLVELHSTLLALALADMTAQTNDEIVVTPDAYARGQAARAELRALLTPTIH